MCVTWDVTVIDTLAASYVPATSETPGAAAETAADRKTSKYATLSQSYLFVPVAVETMGAINRAGMNFLGDLEGALLSIPMITARAPSFSNASLS